MSSGGISFDCLTTSRKVTLPSVDDWGTNMNIVKDPNKGIFTRRKDKVGDTQEVLLAQDASGDRISECINVYARGVNPMVSVSYDNYSNNSGRAMSSNRTAAHLPYKPDRIIPPMYRQEDLMPLSRQPRNWFYTFTNPELPNVLQGMSCPTEKSAIESKKINYSVTNNKSYIKELPADGDGPVLESFLVENVQSKQSNPNQGTFQDLIDTTKPKVHENTLKYHGCTNKTSSLQKNVKSNIDVQKNIRKKLLQQMVHTKKSENRNENIRPNTVHTSIDREERNPISHEGKRINRQVELNPLENFEVMNSKTVKKDVRNSNVSSNKTDSSSLKYLPQFVPYETDRKEITQNLPQFETRTSKFSSMVESIGDMNLENNRNVHSKPLEYSYESNKNKSSTEKIFIDPSNIPIKQTMCIPVQTSKSKNIEKNVTPIVNLETIPTKTKVSTNVETFKSPGEKSNWWIGERPEQHRRVLPSTYNSKPILEGENDLYSIQGRTHEKIMNRNIQKGGFDPKPQAVHQEIRDHIDKSKDSSISNRYSSLKSNVQQQFNQRFFE